MKTDLNRNSIGRRPSQSGPKVMIPWRVVSAYLQRYARSAWERGDVATLARIHNGGPMGHKKRATLTYARKVVNAMKQQNE